MVDEVEQVVIERGIDISGVSHFVPPAETKKITS